MARHRDDATRRRLSRWPVVAVAAVVLLVVGVIGWFQVRDSADRAGADAAATCLDGSSTLTVATTGPLVPALQQLAADYTDRRTVIRDRCVQVSVSEVAPSTVLTGIGGSWDEAGDGTEPALWVPPDASWAARAETVAGDPVAGTPRSLAASPLVLAVPAAAAPAIEAADLSWADVAAAQGTDAWARFGQPTWGAFTQALPPATPGGTLTPLEAQAVVAGTGTGPVTAEQVADPAAATALRTLATGPDPQPATPAAALTALTGLTEVPGSPFQAVATTEAALLGLEQGPTPVAGVLLAGPTPVADFPLVQLAGSWVDETQSRASAAFAEYLQEPDAQTVLADAGFRTGDGAAPAAPEGLVLGQAGEALAPADAATTEALVRATGATPAVAPATAGRTTVLLDVSGSTGAAEGDLTRLRNTSDALATRVSELPATASVGLWPFSRGLDGSLPYRVAVPTGPLGEQVDGTGRTEAIATALEGLVPQSATSSNFALQGAFTVATQSYVAGQPNSILLITDGPNDGTTSTADVLATIRAAADPTRPVRVDVVVTGPGFDTSGLAQVAEATGGTLVDAGPTNTPGLTDALNRLLT